MSTPAIEAFATLLWGEVRENRGSLDSEKWTRRIVDVLDAAIAGPVTIAEAGRVSAEAKAEDLGRKLAAEKKALAKCKKDLKECEEECRDVREALAARTNAFHIAQGILREKEAGYARV